MIEYVKGDLLQSDCDCLINPINCVGVMGKGLALQFKKEYPQMFAMYKKWCNDGQLGIGKIGFYLTKNEPYKIICLFPTKIHWKQKSEVYIVDMSVKSLIRNLKVTKDNHTFEIKSIAFPKVGCGEGGLNFEYQIQPLLEKYFIDSPLKVKVYI